VNKPNDFINQEPERAGDSCEILLTRNDDGQVTGVEVICDTPEARAAMASAINEHDLVVKARAREAGQLEDGKLN